MGLLAGRCTNFGLCSKADSQETQTAPQGLDFVCQECRRRLTPLTAAPVRRRNLNPVWLFVLVGIAALLGSRFFLRKTGADGGVAQQAPAQSNSSVILRLSGSNTIGAQLVPDLVMAWLTSKGASNLGHASTGSDESTVSATLDGNQIAVVVAAHGSATAFTDLRDSKCDIGLSSRPIKNDEAIALSDKGLGDFRSNTQERVLGLDGVAVVVNEANVTSALERSQLADIFSGTGATRDWHVYARDNKSGTYDTFKDRVLGSRPLVSSAQRFEDSRELAQAVARDPSGIGFVGLPYAVGVKTVAISDRGARSLVPNTMTIRTEAYPLSRRLFLYLPQNAKAEATDFVRYALSPAGQEIVEKDGFVGQKVEVMQEHPTTEAPKGYADLTAGSERLSVDFRFRPASSELDSKAADDLRRVVAAMSNRYTSRSVMLAGFADATGSASQNLKLSKERAQAVAASMETQGITPISVLGFGEALPVADNGTPDGRERNRRVEIWLKK